MLLVSRALLNLDGQLGGRMVEFVSLTVLMNAAHGAILSLAALGSALQPHLQQREVGQLASCLALVLHTGRCVLEGLLAAARQRGGRQVMQ